MDTKHAIIVGAGPAGLTAAYALLVRTDIQPVVIEMSDTLGGISRTVNHKGNRIDIGGHRFFSKSDRVMRWWLDMLPLESRNGRPSTIKYQGKRRELLPVETTDAADADSTDEVMLLRSRKSRVSYLRKFFDYPISLNQRTIRNLGWARVLRIGLSYLRARLSPFRRERNLEQFLINRFGRELYLTFFKSYTEKVWGIPCDQISAEWGAQRIKGLSITRALMHALKQPFQNRGDFLQKNTETSLIEQFLYPKYGPGQMWSVCGERVRALGGEILLNTRVDRILTRDNRVSAVVGTDTVSGRQRVFRGDYFFSTMPVRELVAGMGEAVPDRVRGVSDGLVYRDFLTVGLLVSELNVHEGSDEASKLLKDNWIYIQEPDVRVGRLQIFNNWSPYMVADPSKVWLGLEYFCNEGDDLWALDDDALKELAARELQKIGMIDAGNVLDSTVIRMPKAYPAYFGSYDAFDTVRDYLDEFENLFLIGRNGMHRYNNQDHSMLAAMTAVDNIIAGRLDKSNIWDVNADQEYHEVKADRTPKTGETPPILPFRPGRETRREKPGRKAA